MTFVGWARLRQPLPHGMEWGAWYPVTAVTAREARVVVRGKAITVSRAALELRPTPPTEWTVVRAVPTRGPEVQTVPDPYIVCPSCHSSRHLPDQLVETVRCPHCNNAFPIAWDDPFSAAAVGGAPGRGLPDWAPAPKAGLQPDRRRSVRRSRGERRSPKRGANAEGGRARDRRGGVERRRKPTNW
jgi:hypothetical protein